MGKRLKAAIAVLAIALVCVVARLVWPTSEPVYQDKTLTSWLKDYEHRDSEQRI